MSRIGIALLLAAGLSSGCVAENYLLPSGLPFKADKKPAIEEKKGAEAVRTAPRAPVIAGQVNASNARQKAQELRDEMEADLLGHIEGQEK